MDKIEDFRNKVVAYPRLFRITPLIHPRTKKVIESFHIQEGAFKKEKLLPFMARGLFISENDNVLIRGYDKFFNVGETKATQWNKIVDKTTGPYELTLKENGCIIFVGEYEGELLVTSKHSITKLTKEGVEEKNQYAENGKKWLLRAIGDKENELIEYLKLNNVTLVFELIDSSFEDHVIEYSPEEDGLYLHGINKNTIEFETWPSDKVLDFAKQFNFKHVQYKIYNDLNDLKQFVDECNGYYEGKAIEGWVVRCKNKYGKTFFFKMKYDEPYLMFREWREATTAYLNKKFIKYRYTQTNSYMEWIKEKYQTDKSLFKEWKNKRGIIKLRNLYLEETKDGLDYTSIVPKEVTKEGAKYILLIPISCIGFGKTTVAKVLQKLYDIGHIQSDNIKKKRPAPEFINNVCREFDYHKIVMADKNNHLRQHRGMLCEKVKEIYPSTLWIVALHWNIETVSENEILEFSRKRIESRGENHQTLTPKKVGNYPSIVRSFLQHYENLDLSSPEDSFINEVVEIDFKEESKDIVQKIINQLNLDPKSPEEIEKALQEVYSEKVNDDEKKKTKKLNALYYGIKIDESINISSLVEKYIEVYDQQQNKGQENKRNIEVEEIQKILNNKNFMQREHITLAHKKSSSNEEFNYYKKLIDDDENSDREDMMKPVSIGVSSIVWNDKIITLPVDYIDTDKIWESENEGKELNDKGNNSMSNNELDKKIIRHITIAFMGNSKPYDSNELLRKVAYYNKNNKMLNDSSTYSMEKATFVDASTLSSSLTNIKESNYPSFIKPLKLVNGPKWKQLFIEPIKFNGEFTSFYF